MQAQNRKKRAPAATVTRASRDSRKESKVRSFMSKVRLIMTALIARGTDEETAGRRAYHLAYGGGQGEYHPRYHPIMNYRTQQRNAKKRRRAR
jgi:hypothetical protein